MSEFVLNTKTDNIFLIGLSDIANRLDAYYHNPKFDKIEERVSNGGFTFLKKESLKVFSGITPKSGSDLYTNKNVGVPFIRSGDFSEENIINFNKCNYILHSVHNEKMKGSKLKKGDLLIAIVGATIGKVGIFNYDKDANINQAICAVRLNDNFISSFIQVYLNTKFGQLIIDRLKRPVARANINLEEISSIPIPNIKKEAQHEIVGRYNIALHSKQQKEAEAKALLASIDDYLLDELGIKLPAKDNSLENRVFTTSLSEVSGGRLDPFYLINCINVPVSKKIEETELKEITIIKKGQSITSSDIIEGQYSVVAGGKSSPYSHNIFNYEGNVITISASGAYSGYVWYHKKPIFASDCSAVYSQNEEVLNTEFLANVLKFKQQQLYNLQQGSGQPHVYPSDIKKIKIPLPPIEKQTEIAEHISKIRTEAKQLEQEAKDILNQAKLEVETMIFD